MDRRHGSGLAVALALILLGVWFLAIQFVPGLRDWTDSTFAWPMVIIGAGFCLLIVGLLVGAPEMAVPACIVGGIGGIFYWQHATGNWGSWAYAWALIPGFVGVGNLLSGLLGGEARRSAREGVGLVLTSLLLFVLFGALFGGLGFLGPYWPVLLIAWGLALLLRSLLGRR